MLIDGFKVEFIQPGRDKKGNILTGLLTIEGKLQTRKTIFMKAELGPDFDIRHHLTAGINEGHGENYHLRMIKGIELFSDPLYVHVVKLYSRLMCDISQFHPSVIGRGLD